MEHIEIVIQNQNKRKEVPVGTTLKQLADAYTKEAAKSLGKPLPFPILGALVNNRVESLNYCLYRPKVVHFFDITERQGWRMYQNSLCLMLYKAVKDCYPNASLTIEHSLSTGLYCNIDVSDGSTGQQVDESTSQQVDGSTSQRVDGSTSGRVDEWRTQVCKQVRERMIELQKEDIPLLSKTMLVQDAIPLIEEAGLDDTARLMRSLHQIYIEIQWIGGTVQKTANKLVPSTACLATWDLRTYQDGFLLMMPDFQHPEKISFYQETPKLFTVFREHQHLVELLHVPTISDLNEIVRNKGERHLINLSEALHEKKYAEVAEAFAQSGARMILLAGPSSSGKTTSCRRISVQLGVLGYDVKQISLDDYFLPRARTPKLPNGEFDFENIEALDIPLLNEHLNALFNGEEVELPTFDFIKGDPFFDGRKMRLDPESVLVVEGIHALNPRLTEQIDERHKFRVYVSALTQIGIDRQNIIHSGDNRLIRRIVRDNNYRGWDAFETLHRWSEVQRGEYTHIYPYQENADYMFNSALLYELGVLRVFAEPLLKHVPEDTVEFAEAQRLLNFLELIEPIDPKFIPPTSIMREFLGGSSFDY